jgi:hypothetical protein
VAAIAFVANAVIDMDRKPQYAANHDTYEETEYGGWSDESDEPGDPLPTDDSDITSIREALAALVATPGKPPADPFDDDAAELIAMGESQEPTQEQMAIHLSAIWAQGSQTLVLINDRIFTAGDSVGDLTIESTTIDGIWVTHPNGRDFVPVGREFTWIVPNQSRDPNPTLAFNEN